MGRRYLDSRRSSLGAEKQILKDDLRPGPRPTPPSPDDAQPERRRALMGWNFRGDQASIERCLSLVVDQVLRHPLKSKDADLALLKATVPYAAWCVQHTGGFDPEVDLADHLLVDRLPRIWPDAPESSRATRMSALRRLRSGPKPSAGYKRMPQEALTERTWSHLNYAADDAGKYRSDAHVLLGLSGGAGLHTSEIIRARGDWVVKEDKTLCVYVPDDNGEYRVVPVSSRTAQTLGPIAKKRRDDFLLRPDITYRQNVVTSTSEVIRKRTDVWSEFSAVRARHLWLTRLFAAQVPFQIVCAMAGIRRGTSLPADLVHFMERPTLEEIIRQHRSALRHGGGAR